LLFYSIESEKLSFSSFHSQGLTSTVPLSHAELQMRLHISPLGSDSLDDEHHQCRSTH